jgi:ubiquinone/menaquinone biosynthesis C-methylase UbiE
MNRLASETLVAGVALVVAGALAAAVVLDPGAVSAQPGSEAQRLVEVLALKPGDRVAEIGAGDGDLTVEVARILGPGGRVFSTELDPRRLRDIRSAVASAGLQNVTVVEAGERTTNLPRGCCDAIFMRQVYHHIGDRRSFNRSLRESLVPGGRFAVIDFAPGRFLSGGHGASADEVIQQVTAAGFEHVRTVDRWNRNLYLLLFRSGPAAGAAELPKPPGPLGAVTYN